MLPKLISVAARSARSQGEPQHGARETEHWLQAERELQEGLDDEAGAESGGADTGLASSDPAEAIAAETANEPDRGGDADQAAREPNRATSICQRRPPTFGRAPVPRADGVGDAP
jgi:hypothetical protein